MYVDIRNIRTKNKHRERLNFMQKLINCLFPELKEMK